MTRSFLLIFVILHRESSFPPLHPLQLVLGAGEEAGIIITGTMRQVFNL